jgi:hypothetical protein
MVLLLVVFVLIVLATTDDAAVWPVRNTLVYKLGRWWRAQVGEAGPTALAELYGCVRSDEGTVLPDATVLLSEHDGTIHQAAIGAGGCYRIAGIPAGLYVPIASAPGYTDGMIRPWRLPLRLGAGERRALDIALTPASLPGRSPATNLHIGAPITRTWPLPQPGAAARRQITYDHGGRPNQLTYLYTPARSVDEAATARLPTLLAIYPGPADTWEGVSIPLAAAGYAVVAIGPAYALDLEEQIAELQQLVAFARGGLLPQTDGERIDDPE